VGGSHAALLQAEHFAVEVSHPGWRRRYTGCRVREKMGSLSGVDWNESRNQPRVPMQSAPRTSESPILVLGASGKTGRRVADRLEARGIPVRRASRSADPAFDWNDEAGWDAVLNGIRAIYITYAPDLAMPGATDAIRELVRRAACHDVEHLVLLSGRGEKEAQLCEDIVISGGIPWTIVRASWFFQNFSEGAFVSMVQAGVITLPAGDVPEPFVDVDDIADVVVRSLTEPGHEGELYEVTGPRSLTFRQAAEELSKAAGREIRFLSVPHDAFVEEARVSGTPKEVVWMLDYLFSTVLDGRNVETSNGVQRALGRPPRDIAQYAQDVARTGVWDPVQ